MAAKKKPMFPHPFDADREQLEVEAMALVSVAERAIRAADAGDESPMESPECGICRNWHLAGARGRAYSMVAHLSPMWPGFGPEGDRDYPISETPDAMPWEGMNLAHRLDLIAWLLQRYAEWLGAKK